MSKIFAVAGLVAMVPAVVLAMGNRPQVDEEAVNARIQPVAKVKLAPLAPAGGGVGNRSGEELYKAVCSACHDTGAAHAPKIGDKRAWAPRIARGLDSLIKSAKNGRDAMPPNGGSDATADELKRAVVFMANKSGANFK